MSEEAKEAMDPERAVPAVAGAEEPVTAEVAVTARDQSELFTAELLRTLRKVVPVLWLLAAIATDIVWGIQVMLLVLAAGAITLVIALMWSSVQSLTGSTALGFEEALGMGAPSRVEEEKRSVLRALKDLEYERGVGKISPEDYAELLAKYRADAKRLIQSVDDALGPARAEVEKALEQQLTRAGLSPEPEPEVQPEPAKIQEISAKAEPETRAEEES